MSLQKVALAFVTKMLAHMPIIEAPFLQSCLHNCWMEYLRSLFPNRFRIILLRVDILYHFLYNRNVQLNAIQSTLFLSLVSWLNKSIQFSLRKFRCCLPSLFACLRLRPTASSFTILEVTTTQSAHLHYPSTGNVHRHIVKRNRFSESLRLDQTMLSR